MQIAKELATAAEELISIAKPKKGQIFVLGCSTSEVLGNKIGTGGSSESADKEGSAEAKTAAEFATQSTFVGWDFDGTWSMDNFHGRPVLTAIAETDYFSGEGTAESPYLIPDLATLEAFREYVNAGSGAGEYFKLTADIDMSEKYGADIGGSEVSWTPIGNDANQFKGNFDGSGHKISGLYINSTSDYQGLFGYVGEGGTVQDLGVDGTVSGSGCVGGVVGIINNGTVTSCFSTGTVQWEGSSEGDSLGGVAGYNLGTVTNCYATGDVSGWNYVGGVAGICSAVIENCWAKCALSGGRYVGGITGTGVTDSITGSGSTVSGCTSLVSITDYSQYAGAISGSGAGAETILHFMPPAKSINRVVRTLTT